MLRVSSFATTLSFALLLAGPGMADPLCGGLSKVLANMPSDYRKLCDCAGGVPIQEPVPARYKLPGATPVRYYDGTRDVACGIALMFIPVDDASNSVTHRAPSEDAPGTYSCHFPAGSDPLASATALVGRVAACFGLMAPQPAETKPEFIFYEFVSNGALIRVRGEVDHDYNRTRSSADVSLQIIRDDPRLHRQ
jgi:hypothetical protein